MHWIEGLQKRTRSFALAVVRFSMALPRTPEMSVFRYQLVKSGTSVGANYRATCRGRSPAEKIAKCGVAIEESDETAYWLEMLTDLNLGDSRERTRLLKEADELTAILYSCRRGLKESEQRSKNKP
ncbi:MAG TPA: four helix bundle protein [Vicinamibacterales bacterium]